MSCACSVLHPACNILHGVLYLPCVANCLFFRGCHFLAWYLCDASLHKGSVRRPQVFYHLFLFPKPSIFITLSFSTHPFLPPNPGSQSLSSTHTPQVQGTLPSIQSSTTQERILEALVLAEVCIRWRCMAFCFDAMHTV
jgi:hypothetical protein